MKRIVALLLIAFLLLGISCNDKQGDFDATGTFETDEVIVSSEIGGQILSLNIEEGNDVAKDSVIGMIDATNLALQKEQAEATIQSLGDKTMSVAPQVKLLKDQLAVQQSQLDNLNHEQKRIENLLKADAATGKQLDDINAKIDLVKKQMNVTRQQMQVQQSNIATQNRSILSESKPLSKKVAQLDDQLKKAAIVNPISGTVITKYALAGEMTAPGKALYKIANLEYLTLRAYISGIQLSQVQLGQAVKVMIDDGKKTYRTLSGTITWISDKAEFTPKTIQTKDERANLVYAIKIKVKNDGFLKIGMYGEVKFK